MNRTYDDDHDEDGRLVIFDEDNPEWTEERIANARPARDVLGDEFMDAWQAMRVKALDERATAEGDTVDVTLPVGRRVLESYQSQGADWKRRMTDAVADGLRKRA